MPDPHRAILVAIATLELLLGAPSLSQSHATIPGSTLETLRGVTDPNAMNEAWQTALMAAAFDSDEKLVKDLIKRKANVNVGSRFGMTALMYARGLPTVKLLLSAGASVNDKDITGKTALYYAVQQADPDVVHALIKAGANVNAKDDKGVSAQLANLELRADQDLRDAYRKRVQRVIDLLTASGARVDLPIAAAQHGASRDKQKNPIKVHADIPWQKFLVEDVPYLITDEERAAANKLTTGQQRENFITAFWERRNPNPGSPENAFKEEHYRRIAYSNEHFAANVLGWKTDRGRIYIIYGPPNSVQSSHRRSPPTEVWRYVSVQGLGQKVVLTFTDRGKDGSFSLTDEDIDSRPRIRNGQRIC